MCETMTSFHVCECKWQEASLLIPMLRMAFSSFSYTYLDRAVFASVSVSATVPGRPLHDGRVSLAKDGSRFIDRLHAHLLAVHEQLGLTGLHTQGQLVPLPIKQLLHLVEGAQHLRPAVRPRVEEVEGARVAMEAQTHLLVTLWVAHLPQVPGGTGSVFGHLERGDDGVVRGQAVGVDIAAARDHER